MLTKIYSWWGGFCSHHSSVIAAAVEYLKLKRHMCWCLFWNRLIIILFAERCLENENRCQSYGNSKPSGVRTRLMWHFSQAEISDPLRHRQEAHLGSHYDQCIRLIQFVIKYVLHSASSIISFHPTYYTSTSICSNIKLEALCPILN